MYDTRYVYKTFTRVPELLHEYELSRYFTVWLKVLSIEDMVYYGSKCQLDKRSYNQALLYFISIARVIVYSIIINSISTTTTINMSLTLSDLV